MAGELSAECISLVRSLLKRSPLERLSFDELFEHPFLGTARAGAPRHAPRADPVAQSAGLSADTPAADLRGDGSAGGVPVAGLGTAGGADATAVTCTEVASPYAPPRRSPLRPQLPRAELPPGSSPNLNLDIPPPPLRAPGPVDGDLARAASSGLSDSDEYVIVGSPAAALGAAPATALPRGPRLAAHTAENIMLATAAVAAAGGAAGGWAPTEGPPAPCVPGGGEAHRLPEENTAPVPGGSSGGEATLPAGSSAVPQPPQQPPRAATPASRAPPAPLQALSRAASAPALGLQPLSPPAAQSAAQRVALLEAAAGALAHVAESKADAGEALAALSLWVLCLAALEAALRLCRSVTESVTESAGVPDGPQPRSVAAALPGGRLADGLADGLRRAGALAAALGGSTAAAASGAAVVPDGPTLAFACALGLGRHGCVEELMGDGLAASALYGQAQSLLRFLLLEAPLLDVRQPLQARLATCLPPPSDAVASSRA